MLCMTVVFLKIVAILVDEEVTYESMICMDETSLKDLIPKTSQRIMFVQQIHEVEYTMYTEKQTRQCCIVGLVIKVYSRYL